MTEQERMLLESDKRVNEELTSGDKRRMPWSVRITLAAIIMAIFSVIVFIVGNLMLFEPMKVYEYSVQPDAVCPFDEINVTQEIEIEGGLYTINNLEGETFPIQAETNKPGLSSEFDTSRDDGLTALPRATYPSNTVRTAPAVPGEWYAGGHGILSGRMFGVVPVRQEINVVSSNSYIVKEWSDPTCVAKFTGEEQ